MRTGACGVRFLCPKWSRRVNTKLHFRRHSRAVRCIRIVQIVMPMPLRPQALNDGYEWQRSYLALPRAGVVTPEREGRACPSSRPSNDVLQAMEAKQPKLAPMVGSWLPGERPRRRPLWPKSRPRSAPRRPAGVMPARTVANASCTVVARRTASTGGRGEVPSSTASALHLI
jgi:hypothetical protein